MSYYNEYKGNTTILFYFIYYPQNKITMLHNI